jgi:hypothetical protein
VLLATPPSKRARWSIVTTGNRIEGAGRGADEEIGGDVVVGEGLKHADLDGAEAAAAG